MITATWQAKFLNPTEVIVTGPAELRAWRDNLTVAVPGAEFTPQFKRGKWDGMYTPGRYCTAKNGQDDQYVMRCSAGLLYKLQQDYPFQLPERPVLTAPPTHTAYKTFHDYQLTAFTEALAKYWGRVALATNAGKGAVIALLAQTAAASGRRTLILCDEKSVFEALGGTRGAPGEIHKWTGITPGEVKAGVSIPPSNQIVLAMVPTVYRRLPKKGESGTLDETWVVWLQSFDMVLLDEADKSTAPTWKRLLSYTEKTWWRIGFSGTFPEKGDADYNPHMDLRLEELMGPILITQKNRDLVARGISARPLVALHSYDVTHTLTHAPRMWWKLPGPELRKWCYEQAIVHNPDRHNYITSLIQPGVPTALIVNRIAHGKALASHIPGSMFLDGSASTAERDRVLSLFQSGEVSIIIATKILDRGTNRLGLAADILFVSGEGSTAQTLQRIGRGLRRTGGKAYLRLVDIVDKVSLDGETGRFLPRAAKLLHRAARKRVELYNNEGFEVTIERRGP